MIYKTWLGGAQGVTGREEGRQEELLSFKNGRFYEHQVARILLGKPRPPSVLLMRERGEKARMS